MSLPYFRQHGWEPVVLAVDSSAVEAAEDRDLLNTLPADIAIHRVGALPAKWTRPFGLGNIGYRAWFQINAAGRKLLQAHQFDLVYFSTTQFIVTTLGARWRRDFGTPFVVDIQDPWRTDYYERPGAPKPPGGWKYRFARWQATRLEKRCWRDAAGFISVSEEYLSQLDRRYPWFQAKPAVTIPFGAPEIDFSYVTQNRSIPIAFERVAGEIYLVSVGAIGSIMHPALRTLFAGLAEFRLKRPEEAAKIRLIFIGTSYAPPGRESPSVKPLAIEAGVGEFVTEHPARISYFSAIKTMVASDALFIPGSDDAGYSPSKIGACFLSERPVLAVVPDGSAAAARILSLGFARVVSPDAINSSVQIAHFLSDLVRGVPPHCGKNRDAQGFAATATASAVTQRQCALFERALRASI